jgi:hypothetical protein
LIAHELSNGSIWRQAMLEFVEPPHLDPFGFSAGIGNAVHNQLILYHGFLVNRRPELSLCAQSSPPIHERSDGIVEIGREIIHDGAWQQHGSSLCPCSEQDR